MYILGISCYYHDSAACLIKDGNIIAAAEEERFTRKKHDNSFPENAIRFCLKKAKIPIKKISNHIHHVVFYEKPLLKFERILETHLDMWPFSFRSFHEAIPSWLTMKLKLPSELKKKIGYQGEIAYVDHHISHSASSFFLSGFKEAALVNIDGVGEWTTTSYGVAKENDIDLQYELRFPSSIGLLYNAITAFLGFKVNNDEYKVMGLSAYGRARYLDRLKKVVKLKDDGSFALDMSYFSFLRGKRMLSRRFYKEFGSPRKKDGPLTQFHKDMASSLQVLCEEIILKMLTAINKKTGMKNLCLSGGVALNSVLNGKILSNTGFENIFINPAPGDSGAAIGCALYLYHSVLKHGFPKKLEHAYLGPDFSEHYIENFLKRKGIIYKHLSSRKELLAQTARLIKENNIVSWFQGRMEFGPRALGNRSILANPLNPKMKDILNRRVKHREDFRPFAPSVAEEDVSSYFDHDNPLPKPASFMLLVYPIREDVKMKIPAVTHVDGTGRLQVVSRKDNPVYYDLIRAFEVLSGVPVIINTSFNIRGEPIVCTPEDAFRCMMGTGIDYLVMGDYVIKKEDNMKFAWDSEKELKKSISKGLTN